MLFLTYTRTHFGRLLTVALAALVLAGCPGQLSKPLVDIQNSADASSEYYFSQLENSAEKDQINWQILAARALLREGKTSQALEQLNKLPQTLNKTQSNEVLLLRSEIQVAQNQRSEAAKTLKLINLKALSDAQQIRYYQVIINIAPSAPSLETIRAYISQQALFNNQQAQESQTNLNQTWLLLSKYSPAEVAGLTIQSHEETLRGWVDLLMVYQSNRHSLESLKNAVQEWQTRYPKHPASLTLPTALSQSFEVRPASTTKVALLLPLSGNNAAIGNAIRAGFSDAMQGKVSTPRPISMPVPEPTDNTITSEGSVTAEGETAPPAPATPVASGYPSASNSQLKLYDTAAQPLDVLLRQAEQDGVTLIVGPLMKPEVEQTVKNPMMLSTLALNQPENTENIIDRINVCYFSLSPEDEAQDAARLIKADGKSNPIILAPSGKYGARVAKAFSDQWIQETGTAPQLQYFGSLPELRQRLNRGTGIVLRGQTPVQTPSATPAGNDIVVPPSSASVTSITDAANTSSPAATSSGGSTDAVYIIATQSELELIKPLIDMNAGPRSGLSIYTSSRSNQSSNSVDYRLEMDGVQFNDIPLLTGGNPELLRQARSQFNNNYGLIRLYAMGADAWLLANHFAALRTNNTFVVEGNTGTITADSRCVVKRKLPWFKYQQGMIVPVQ